MISTSTVHGRVIQVEARVRVTLAGLPKFGVGLGRLGLGLRQVRLGAHRGTRGTPVRAPAQASRLRGSDSARLSLRGVTAAASAGGPGRMSVTRLGPESEAALSQPVAQVRRCPGPGPLIARRGCHPTRTRIRAAARPPTPPGPGPGPTHTVRLGSAANPDTILQVMTLLYAIIVSDDPSRAAPAVHHTARQRPPVEARLSRLHVERLAAPDTGG
jgi:hypothetical protein